MYQYDYQILQQLQQINTRVQNLESLVGENNDLLSNIYGWFTSNFDTVLRCCLLGVFAVVLYIFVRLFLKRGER